MGEMTATLVPLFDKKVVQLLEQREQEIQSGSGTRIADLKELEVRMGPKRVLAAAVAE
jgi:hypothetical protein